MPKVAIVGGGIAGLYSALLCAKAGHDVTLFEASEKLGGAIASTTLANDTFDIGAEAFSVVRPETLDLLHELESEYLVVEPKRSDARVIVGERRHLLPAGILGIPANLQSPEALELLGAETSETAEELDTLPWQKQLLNHDISLGDLVATRLGNEVVKLSVEPIIAGVHASDPFLLEADSVAPGLRSKAAELGSLTAAVAAMRASSKTRDKPGSAVASLLGGMTTLVFTITEVLRELGVDIKLNHAINKLTELGEFDFHVIAVNPTTAAKITAALPELSNELQALKTVDVALCLLLVKSEKLNFEPLGSGALVSPEDSRVEAKATTHVNAKWQWVSDALPKDHHLIRLSYGRNGVLPELDDSLIETALKDAAWLYEAQDIELIEGKIITWPGTLVQATSGHQGHLAKIQDALRQHPSLTFVGAGFGSNGITGILAQTSKAISKLGLV